MTGGAIAGLVYDLIFAADSSLRKLGDCASSEDYDAEDDHDNDNKRPVNWASSVSSFPARGCSVGR
jgi:hypothetical protein